MMREYFLSTERIRFSFWREEDRILAHTLWGDPSVSKYITASGLFTKEMIDQRLQLEIANQKQHQFQYWPIFERHTGAFIGCCGLRPKTEGVLEFGIHLLPDFWGKGYAGEAAHAVIHYASTVLQVKKLFAGHNPQNIRSEKFLKKLGFSPIGTEFYPPTGLYHPSYEMDLMSVQSDLLEE